MKIKKDTYGEIFRRYTVEKQTLKQIAIDFQCTPGRISQIIKAVRDENNADKFFGQS
jgi:hypothetical protein